MSTRTTGFSRFARRNGMEIVSLTLPGNKWVTAMEMTCRVCGKHDHVVSVKHSAGSALMPPEIALKKFKSLGWEVRGMKTTCPDCLTGAQRQARVSQAALPPPKLIALPEPPPDELQEPTVILIENEEPEMAETADVRNIEPDRLGKRLIHAEIAGNWDDERGRYIGSATDQSIADALKVPRAWVTNIRMDFFGDDGTNEEIGLLKNELAAAISRFDQSADEALRLASSMEKQAGELKALRTRLERVERQSLPKRGG